MGSTIILFIYPLVPYNGSYFLCQSYTGINLLAYADYLVEKPNEKYDSDDNPVIAKVRETIVLHQF